MSDGDHDTPAAPRSLADAALAAGVGLVVRVAIEEVHRIARKLLVRLRAHGAPASTRVGVSWTVGDPEAIVAAVDDDVDTTAGDAPRRRHKRGDTNALGDDLRDDRKRGR